MRRVEKVAGFGQFHLIGQPTADGIESAQVRVVQSNSLRVKDAPDQLNELPAWSLVEVEKQRAAAKLVQLLHSSTLPRSLARISLLLRRESTYNQGADFERSKGDPILGIANCKDKNRCLEKIVKTKCRKDGGDRRLPETGNNSHRNDTQEKKKALGRCVEMKNKPAKSN